MKLEITKVSLTSLEIAELTAKRHPDVVRDIETQLSEVCSLSKFAQSFKRDNGQTYKMYNLPKRECLILVSGYNVKLRAAIIDRLEYLEAHNTSVSSHEKPYYLKEVDTTNKRVRRAFYKAFDGKCYYTQKPLSFEMFHIDHILPQSRGGQNILMNLVVCDPAVNSSKLNAYDEAFVLKHQEIVKHNQALKVIALLTNSDKLKVSSKDIGSLLNYKTIEKLESVFGIALAREFYGDMLGIAYEKIDKKYLTTDENISSYIKEVITPTDQSFASSDKVYESYKKWCLDGQILPISRAHFFKKLKATTGLESYQKRVDGTRVRVLDLEIGA